ncbi:hypothetical protein ACFPK9_09545 [Rubritalea spongiae]|uniref:Tetratricopeptide repeat protein n=1 Tax=Rubritalea spongiae TaxID=430797 RepID=A0ABW5E601_9BACT
MKILSKVATLAVALTVSAVAQQASTPGTITLSDGSTRNGYIVGSTKTSLFYLENEGDEKPQSVRMSQVDGVYLMQPSDYTEAMELYQDRKYSEAAKRFDELKKKYKKLELLPDNFHHLAGYYKLECLRKQMDLPTLTKEVTNFGTPELLREYQQQQLEAYAFWTGINAKAWGRVIRMAEDWQSKRLPVSIRAQVAYCHGLALEKEGRSEDALFAYAIAMTADYTQSEVIVRNAVINSLRVYKSLPAVEKALKSKSAEQPDLVKAGALAALYERAGLGAGVALPAEYKVFLEYAPEVVVPDEKGKPAAAKDAGTPEKKKPAETAKSAAQKKKPVAQPAPKKKATPKKNK